MTLATSLLQQTEALRQTYKFIRPDEVTAYLEQYPFLLPLLIAAPAKIQQYFPNSPLYLEVVSFRDSVDGECCLFARIVPESNLEPEEAAVILERFGDDWWLDASDAAENKFEITIGWR